VKYLFQNEISDGFQKLSEAGCEKKKAPQRKAAQTG